MEATVAVMARNATCAAGPREPSSPGAQEERLGDLVYPVGVLAQMRDRTGGPRARYRLLALLIAVGMLLAAAPLLISIIASLVDGLRG